MFSANADGAYVHAHTVVLGAPPRADCRRVCAMNFRRRLYSHQPIAVNSLAHCRSNVLTSYESRTQPRTVPHSRAVRSLEADATSAPSGEQSTAVTGALWRYTKPLRLFSADFSAQDCHTRTVPSAQPDTTVPAPHPRDCETQAAGEEGAEKAHTDKRRRHSARRLARASGACQAHRPAGS